MSPSCLNYYSPVTLTSSVLRDLWKMCWSLPSSFDPLQRAHRANRGREAAMSNLLYTTHSHLEEGKGNYGRILFIHFKVSLQHHCTTHMKALELNTPLCHWRLNLYSFTSCQCGGPDIWHTDHQHKHSASLCLVIYSWLQQQYSNVPSSSLQMTLWLWGFNHWWQRAGLREPG